MNHGVVGACGRWCVGELSVCVAVVTRVRARRSRVGTLGRGVIVMQMACGLGMVRDRRCEVSVRFVHSTSATKQLSLFVHSTLTDTPLISALTAQTW